MRPVGYLLKRISQVHHLALANVVFQFDPPLPYFSSLYPLQPSETTHLCGPQTHPVYPHLWALLTLFSLSGVPITLIIP